MAPKPLVFVPGLPGTVILEQASTLELFPNLLSLIDPSLREEMVKKLPGPDDPNADDGVVPGDPVDSLIPGLSSSFIDFSGTLKQADSLYGLLAGLGYTQTSTPFGGRFRPIGWDWRRPVDGTRAQADLKRAITDLHTVTGEKVVILCHSTGGLVTRSLLEDDPTLVPLLDQVIAIAIPWAGTPQTLPYLSGHQGFFPLSSAQAQQILGHSWAAFDLLPPDPQRTDMTDAEGDLDFFTAGAGQTSPLVETAWMPIGPLGPPFALRAARSNTQFGARKRPWVSTSRS